MKLGWCHMSHVTSRSCDGMWNMKHEEWCHKWCHMEKGYKHGKSYLNQGLRYIFRIIKAWRPCEWQKGINVIENKRIMRIKKRYSWIYLTGKWIPYRYTPLPKPVRPSQIVWDVLFEGLYEQRMLDVFNVYAAVFRGLAGMDDGNGLEELLLNRYNLD